MARAFAAIAVATAFHLLAALHGASAARPMEWQAAASSGTTTSALALAPAGHQDHQLRTAAATRAGKWLPFAGVHHHLPAAAAYWAHRPVPWVGAGDLAGGAGAVEGSEGEEVVRERPERERRQRPSYEGDGTTTTTRQEQLAMWASLLNPKGKGRTAATATGWMPAPGAGGEVADDEPAKVADAVEGAEADDSAADGARVGQTYWGNNGN